MCLRTFEMIPIERSGEKVLAYTMSSVEEGKKALVLLNFSSERQRFAGDGYAGWKAIIGRGMGESKIDHHVDLAA